MPPPPPPPPPPRTLEEDRAWAKTHFGPFASCAVFNWGDTDGHHVYNDGTPKTAFDWQARQAVEKQYGCKIRQHVIAAEAVRHTLELDERERYMGQLLRIREQYGLAIDARTTVVDFIVNSSLLRLQHNAHTYAGGKGARVLPQCESFEDALHRLRCNFELLPERQARKIYDAMRSYYANAKYLRHNSRMQIAQRKQSKQQRIEEKPNGNCWLVSPHVDEDVLAEILKWVQGPFLFKLERTCKAMAAQPTIALMKPHLSVRCLPTTFGTSAEAERHVLQKWFPHYTEKRAGTSESEVHVVCKKRAVVLLVDLVQCGSVGAIPIAAARRTRTHRDVNADGEPSNWHRTEVYERPAERRARCDNAEQCRTRMAPEDGHVQEGWFRKRYVAATYFDDELHVADVQLLYADTLEPVPVSRGEPAARLNRLTKKDDAYRMHSTYTSTDGVPYPAKVSVTVNALSSLHDGRSFVLRVRAEGKTGGWQRPQVLLTAITPKFQSVYKLAAAQMQFHNP